VDKTYGDYYDFDDDDAYFHRKLEEAEGIGAKYPDEPVALNLALHNAVNADRQRRFRKRRKAEIAILQDTVAELEAEVERLRAANRLLQSALFGDGVSLS
jgi:uncharacterized protein involved in exopolysaccharide biosynthesis